jgi:hypothetical protein
MFEHSFIFNYIDRNMFNMRRIIILFFLVFVASCRQVYAGVVSSNTIYVFSKQSYYTYEKEAYMMCFLSKVPNFRNYYLQLFNSKKEKVRTYQFTDSLLRIAIKTESLILGKNRFFVRVFNQQYIAKDTVVEINRLAPVKNEVKIDYENGGLIVDGLPFFPFGFYCEKVGQMPEHEVVNGFNFIGPYQNNLPEGLPERKAYMDRCAQLGMKVQYGVNSLIGSGHNDDKGLEKTEEEKLAILKNEILTFKDHPALLSWYINDEPDGQGRSPEILEKAYNLIHKIDPYHPIAIVFMIPSKFNEFGKTMDIAMTDPYPIPESVDIRSYIDQLNCDFRYRKSIWLVPQAFGGQEMWSRESTPKELRVMTYLGLLEGVKGIQYFIRSENNLAPQSVGDWSECSNMAVEVGQMTPFLLSNERQQTLQTGNSDILAKSYWYKGNRLVVVVNKSNQPAIFSIDLDSVEYNDDAYVWFENRHVRLSKTVLKDMIDALGTRVYIFKSKNSNNKNVIYPGNIIYNPGFEEVVTPGLATGQGRSYSNFGKIDFGATVFTDSRQSVEGLFSLRMCTPSDNAGKTIHFLPITLRAGETYNVSIWAKTLKSEREPHFNLSIDSEKIEKSFETSDEWKKYSFSFKATTSTTNAIVNLDLVDKGTAWFDLMQVVPDPVMHYTINSNHSAIVSISTILKNAIIKYSFSDTGVEQEYVKPFKVNESVTVKAFLYKDKKELANSSIFVPVNKALGKPVYFETPYNEQYNSIGDGTLTDGVMGTTSFRDKKWLGFLQPEVTFTVDLQRSTEISSVVTNFLSDANSGIFLPRVIDVLISDNNRDFTLVRQKINETNSKRGEPYIVPLEVLFDKVKTRYIRLKIKTFGEIPEGYLFKGTTSWLFTDEILVK